MKNLYLMSLFILVVGLTACSDNSEEKSKEVNINAVKTETPKIEIVENSNAHAIKVEQKIADKTDGSSYYYDYGEKSEYDQNAQPANEDASVRVRPRTTVEANMNVRSPYEEVKVSMLLNKLSKDFILRCSACHNDYANGIIGPSLLGKDSNYIYEKIIEFKNGEKKNVLMNDLVKMMSDDELRKIADEIYNFNKEIKQMRNR